MLKLLLKDAIKHPGKLLALCFVVYLASMSFFVACFLALLGAGLARKSIQQKVKAAEAAEAEAANAEALKVQAAQPVAAATMTATAAANDTVAAPPAPKRQYAKSAVVIPFKTGTR